MIRIGITGHRFLSDTDRLSTGIEAVLERLEDRYPEAWCVVSCAAEGADRLVAGRLLARAGTGLVVILPLPREQYVEDFLTAASRAEFDSLLSQADEVLVTPPQPSRDASYASAGERLLDLSDVIVAVWDGLAEQGPGGTGDVVGQARERGLPIAWVHAGNRRPGTSEPTGLGDEEGRVTFERLPDHDDRALRLEQDLLGDRPEQQFLP